MKNLSKILLAAALTVAFTSVNRAQAGEPFYSPKAKQVADSLRTVPSTDRDMVDRSLQPGTPKSREFASSLRTVPSTGPSIDLAHAPRPTLSPKDDRYEMALRENAVKQLDIQIAPLK